MNFKYYNSSKLIIFILILSVLYNIIVTNLLSYFKENEIVSKIIDYIGISTVGLIILTLIGINQIGWKFKIFKWLINIPDLSGRYEGTLISSYKDENGIEIQKNCTIEIKQTASSIHIFSYYGDTNTNTQSSVSYSVSEQIAMLPNGFFEVYYIYTNEPDVLLTQLSNHSGTARLSYYPDLRKIKGEYYNKRKNTGTFEVIHKQDKLLGRLSF